jgi:hypothetical protein
MSTRAFDLREHPGRLTPAMLVIGLLDMELAASGNLCLISTPSYPSWAPAACNRGHHLASRWTLDSYPLSRHAPTSYQSTIGSSYKWLLAQIADPSSWCVRTRKYPRKPAAPMHGERGDVLDRLIRSRHVIIRARRERPEIVSAQECGQRSRNTGFCGLLQTVET